MGIVSSNSSLALTSWLCWYVIFCSESCRFFFYLCPGINSSTKLCPLSWFSLRRKKAIKAQCTCMRFIKDLKTVLCHSKGTGVSKYFVLPVIEWIGNTCLWVWCLFSMCITLRDTVCLSLVYFELQDTMNYVIRVLLSASCLLPLANRRHGIILERI